MCEGWPYQRPAYKQSVTIHVEAVRQIYKMANVEARLEQQECALRD